MKEKKEMSVSRVGRMELKHHILLAFTVLPDRSARGEGATLITIVATATASRGWEL